MGSSLVGQAGLEGQMTLPPILAEAGARLFIPSDYAFTHNGPDDQLVPVMKNKAVLEGELKKAGIPTLNIMAGNFAEFVLNTPYVFTYIPAELSRRPLRGQDTNKQDRGG